jgi:HEPN domain-containing protein
MKIPLEIPRRGVPKGKYPVYLRKADEFLAEAKDAFLKERFNVAAACAAHSAINALDSLTIHRFGARHAGPRHLDATFMLKYLDIPQKAEAEVKFEAAVNVKSAAEYEDRLVSKGEAEIAIKRAEQFLRWVKGNLPP